MLSTGKGGSATVYGHALSHATYERHRPEQALLYQLVENHYPALVEQLEFQGKSLPAHVHREFESYLKCGHLEACYPDQSQSSRKSDPVILFGRYQSIAPQKDGTLAHAVKT